MYDGEVENRLPAIYSFPAYRDDAYRARTAKRVVPGCSPWLYLPRPPRLATRATILMMPAHSSVDIAADMDDDRFAQQVRQLYPGEEVQCCVYWRDLQLGRHLPYLRRGIPVVSAGHIFDPQYFERLARIFTTAKLMVTNEFGSHVFYSASHDVPVVVLPDVRVRWAAPDDLLSRHCSTGPHARVFEDMAPLFQQAAPEASKQRSASEFMLGAERAARGAQLRDLLEELWRTPGFLSRVLRWHLSRQLGPARSLLRRLVG